MDDLIRFLLGKPDSWVDIEKHDEYLEATHTEQGRVKIVHLPAFDEFDILQLAIPCAVAFSCKGDDPDSSVTDYIKALRGRKRSKKSDSPEDDDDDYVIYCKLSL